MAEGLVHVAVDAGELLASYTTPGQYVQVRVEGRLCVDV